MVCRRASVAEAAKAADASVACAVPTTRAIPVLAGQMQKYVSPWSEHTIQSRRRTHHHHPHCIIPTTVYRRMLFCLIVVQCTYALGPVVWRTRTATDPSSSWRVVNERDRFTVDSDDNNSGPSVCALFSCRRRTMPFPHVGVLYSTLAEELDTLDTLSHSYDDEQDIAVPYFAERIHADHHAMPTVQFAEETGDSSLALLEQPQTAQLNGAFEEVAKELEIPERATKVRRWNLRRLLFWRKDKPTLTQTITTTSRSLWRHRHARSAEEGIRRETTTRTTSARQLSSVLARAGSSIGQTSRHYAARTITGLITALAEEVEDLDVEVDARDDTPIHCKHVNLVKIKFSRLGFKPLRMGGHDTAVNAVHDKFVRSGRLFDRKLIFGLGSKEEDDTLSADEAFDRIDVDNSGFLDRDELIQALSLAASTSNAAVNENVESDSNLPILEKLASDLFKLYDTNGDGVVDRKEYKNLVEDMAALKKAQALSERKQREKDLGAKNSDKDGTDEGWVATSVKFLQSKVSAVQNKTAGLLPFSDDSMVSGSSRGEELRSSDLPKAHDQDSLNDVSDLGALENDGDTTVIEVPAESVEVVETMTKRLGSIAFTDMKMDLRRLFFGGIPIVKRIIPGGPLILEPFTATITGSFNREDLMNSFLLDAGLRRLVMRALRMRVGFLRDFLEGAVFKGRSWKTFSAEGGPRVEIPELTNIEFDSNDKLIVTGLARVRTRPDSPVVEQAFKLRTRIGTHTNGRFIFLEEPELALVIECPKAWDQSIGTAFENLNLQRPERPKPIYSFFPIYSPFKLQDDGGFDLGEDNSIRSLFIRDGALRFEMSAVLRPGRFLGSHYVAFTIPIRTVIVTLDRVTEGIRAARRVKKANRALKPVPDHQHNKEELRRISLRRANEALDRAEDALLARQEERIKNANTGTKKVKLKSFFSRFVDGYLQADRDEARKEKMTIAIRDFFGRQDSGR